MLKEVYHETFKKVAKKAAVHQGIALGRLASFSRGLLAMAEEEERR